MKIQCPECNEVVPAEHIELNREVATCPDCNTLFSISEQIDRIAGPPKPRREIDLPDKVQVYQDRGELYLVMRWFNKTVIGLTFFCILWDGFMAFWFSIALLNGEWEMALYGTLHALVGVGLTYYTIAGYVNKTYIGVSSEIIKVKHAPLPSWGNKTIEARDVRQIYVKEHVSQGKNSTTITYEVHADTLSAGHLKLVSGIDSSEKALFIEQEIEKFLRIKDTPVSGEFPRG